MTEKYIGMNFVRGRVPAIFSIQSPFGKAHVPQIQRVKKDEGLMSSQENFP